MDKMDELKEAYEELKQKHGLPAFDELNWEYELAGIEVDDLLIRNVRKKVTEKFEFIANVLSGILQPESDLASLHEVSFFSDPEKEELVKVYKQLMYYYRRASKLVVEDTPETNAEFIKEAHVALIKLKPQLLACFDNITETWKKELKELKESGEKGYFG